MNDVKHQATQAECRAEQGNELERDNHRPRGGGFRAAPGAGSWGPEARGERK